MAAIQRLMSTTIALGMLFAGDLARETAALSREPPGKRRLLAPRHPLSRAMTIRARQDPEAAPHIRMEDQRLGDLLDYGRRRSALLQNLIDRLEASDVVAYVRCDHRLRRGVAGSLSFVGSTAGTRYVLVRVGYVGDRLRQIALLGHELRHGVEVADTPAIVDTASFQREYARLGYVNKLASVEGITAFESDSAVDAGEQILRELRNDTE